MIGVTFQVLSEYNILLGISYQKGSEYLDDVKHDFKEIAIGLIFVYVRIAKYRKTEEEG